MIGAPDAAGSIQKRFLAAIESAYRAAADPAYWPYALKAIAESFDDQGAILIFKKSDSSTAIIVSDGLEQLAQAYNDVWWQHDFRLRRSFERGYIANLDTITDRHVVTLEETETHPFYRDFLASYGLKWFAGTTIWPEVESWAGLALERSKDKPPYDDQELADFTMLSRHVENALRLGVRLINAEIKSRSLAEALSSLNVGIFFVNRKGKAFPANRTAERLVGEVVLLRHGFLAVRGGLANKTLSTAIKDAVVPLADAPPAVPQPIVVHGETPAHSAVLYVIPFFAGSSTNLAEEALADVAAFVMVVRSNPDQLPDPGIVRDLLGVTLAEARVAALIGKGMPPRSVAVELGISEETVRTTLKRVFQKTGVSRQSQLASLLSTLVVASRRSR